MATCINLQERFGRRYKITYGESYDAEYGPNARTEDPWHMILLCQRGHICAWGSDELAACTDKNGATANKLRKLPFIQIVQDGEDGVNAVFTIEHFVEIAQLMKPRRRKTLTEEQKAANVERLAKYQFPAARQSTGEEHRRDAEGPDGSEPVNRQLGLFDR